MIYRRNLFSKFASKTAFHTGHPFFFLGALALILLWAIAGPLCRFSNEWQLVINTGTTLCTFLMVFIIQNTQNRDNAAVQAKLDELLRVTEGAHNSLLDIEELSQEDLAEIRQRYAGLARAARKELREGKADTGKPKVKAAAKKN